MTAAMKGPALQRRVRRYIERHFKGDVRQAAKALRCNYDALWRMSNGRFIRPNIACLHALAKHSKLSIEWWLTGEVK